MSNNMWFTRLNINDIAITVLFAFLSLRLFSKRIENLLHAIAVKCSVRKIQIRVITNKNECREACALLKEHCQDLNALGFDCEWLSRGVPRPVSLLQLSTVHGLCCLFRLHLLGDIPQDLQWILNNCDIIKLGICPGEDAKLLERDYNIKVFSTLDLRHLYPPGGGLAAMSEKLLGITLDKSPILRGSNWEISELTKTQKEYAAKDAFVGIEIFKKWLLDKSKRRYAILRIPYKNLFDCDIKQEISQYLGIPFQQVTSPKKNKKPVCESVHLVTTKKDQEVQQQQQHHQQQQQKATHITRKTPLYHNCFMHAPDGELLCSCDTKKAAWYLDRGLAEVLPGEPYSIRLLFEPAARADEYNGGRYYQLLKQNCCVVCGAKESYLKHNVVPREYRKHFPNAMKNHQSHDVVLMCIECHLQATQHANVLKQKLAKYCNAPIKSSVYPHSKQRLRIKNYAGALLKSGNELPTERKLFLENEIKKYYMVDNVTWDLLYQASILNTGCVSHEHESHGLRVTSFFAKQPNGLIELEKMWRTHFLRTMEPKYLPALWSVSHNHSRLLAQKNGIAL